jgi:transposase
LALPAPDTFCPQVVEEVVVMEVVHSRCAGMDVSKRDAKVCVRVAGRGRRKTVETVRTWASTTNAILRLREHLIAERVSLVVMEATGDYWKPFYYLLEDAGFEVMLVNARQVKNLPGRKSDVSDATWLAQLGAHGLVRGCFVPPAPIRELRDLTRARTMLTRERGREIQRLEKHHAFLTRMYLEVIDQRAQQIEQLNARIDAAMEPYTSIPAQRSCTTSMTTTSSTTCGQNVSGAGRAKKE